MIFIVDLNRDLNRFKSLDLNHIHPDVWNQQLHTAMDKVLSGRQANEGYR